MAKRYGSEHDEYIPEKRNDLPACIISLQISGLGLEQLDLRGPVVSDALNRLRY